MENTLKNTKISEYLDLLRDGTDIERIQEIDGLLSSKIQSVSSGFDLALFQMEKDILLLTCKFLIAQFENALEGNFEDSPKMIQCAKRIEELRIQRDKKKTKAIESTPYQSFIQWLLTLKKYYGSDIDKSNDLLYLVEATNVMMKSFAVQEKQIEQQKAKKK